MLSMLPSFRLLAICTLLAVSALPPALIAQDDAPSLGDLARNLRKSKVPPPPQPAADPLHPIIDNDNLAQATEDAKNARPAKQNKTVFSIDPSTNTLKVSSPDVTCSLSFNARASALLIKPVLVEDLPLAELLKLDGPGSIQDENLQLEVFNGTDWDLREITIGLTLERKPGQNAEVAARARIIPAAEGLAPIVVERRSDVTILYHLKAQAKPFSTTAFHENIGITPGPDEDWRWSIVEAKGIRPSQAPQSTDSIREEPLFSMPSSLLPNADQPALVPDYPAIQTVPMAAVPSPVPDNPAAEKDKPSTRKPQTPSPMPQQ